MAIKVRVRCLNKIHSIVLADNGQLCLCDHGGKHGIEDIQALIALGLGEPRCLQILKWWGQRVLSDVETKKIPPALLKYWRIIHHSRKAVRIQRKLCQKRNELFLDGTLTSYPADIDQKLPDGFTVDDRTEKGAFDDVYQRKRAVFATKQLVKELERRGHTDIDWSADYKQSKSWSGQVYSWESVCKVDTGSSKCHVRYDSQGNNYIINSTTHPVSFSIKDGVPCKLAVDLLEIVSHESKLSHQRAEETRARHQYFNGFESKLKNIFPGIQFLADRDWKSGRMYVKINMGFNDKMATAQYLQHMTKAVQRLKSQGRVIFGPVT